MCFIDKQHNSCRCENGPLLILLLPIWWFCYRNGRFIFIFSFLSTHTTIKKNLSINPNGQFNTTTAFTQHWLTNDGSSSFLFIISQREKDTKQREKKWKKKITAITIVTCNCLEFSFGMTRCNCKKRENTKSHRLLSIFIILFFLPPKLKLLH